MKSLKTFIKSWYYFLKEEKWVARTFAVIAILVCIMIGKISNYMVFYRYNVWECGKIKNYSSSFEIVAQKLHECFEEESQNDRDMVWLRAFLTHDGLEYVRMYNIISYSESETPQLSFREKQSARNIRKTLPDSERYVYIDVYEDQVIFRVTTDYDICWFPDGKKPEKLQLINGVKHYVLRRVHGFFPHLYILYQKEYRGYV